MFSLLSLTVTPISPLHAPSFTGPVLRSVLGAALRHGECTQACGDGPCLSEQNCGYTHAFYPVDASPPFRLDSSDLDGRQVAPGESWLLKLICFKPGLLPMYQKALQLSLYKGLGSTRISHKILEEDIISISLEDISERAQSFDTITVFLPTPTSLKKNNKQNAHPSLDDILHATLRRAHHLNIDTSIFPRFNNIFDAVPLQLDHIHLRRWSTRQGRQIPLKGVCAAWRLRPSPEQAWWLALAEVLGIGKGTTMGMGVVQILAD